MSRKCLVDLLKQYLSRGPQELQDKGPFYLAIIENHKTNVWYKKRRLDVNSNDNMMKGVIKNTPLETSNTRRNHNARKTVVKKLRATSVERQSIIQVTGYASEKSVNDHDGESEKEQQKFSNIIDRTPQSAASSSSPDLTISFFSSNDFNVQVNTSGHAFTVNNFH